MEQILLAFSDPQDWERLLVARENARDVDGMSALYERYASLDHGGGKLIRGRDAIHRFFAERSVFDCNGGNWAGPGGPAAEIEILWQAQQRFVSC